MQLFVFKYPSFQFKMNEVSHILLVYVDNEFDTFNKVYMFH